MNWKTIESAPRDGTPVDLWMPAQKTANGDHIPAHRIADCSFLDGEWKLGGEFSFLGSKDILSHWMPQPPAPQATCRWVIIGRGQFSNDYTTGCGTGVCRDNRRLGGNCPNCGLPIKVVAAKEGSDGRTTTNTTITAR